MRRAYIRHVRHPLNPSRYIATVAVVICGTEVKVGFSQCHPDDQFSKKDGKNRAVGRAYSLTPLVDKDGNPLKPVPFIFYETDGTKYRVDVVRTAMMDLCAQIAEQLLEKEEVKV